MANRFTENKSLIDCITPPNELLNIRAIPGGHRYRFSGRVLPDWFKKKAKSANCAMVDNDAAQNRPGRTVSIVKNKHPSR